MKLPTLLSSQTCLYCEYKAPELSQGIGLGQKRGNRWAAFCASVAGTPMSTHEWSHLSFVPTKTEEHEKEELAAAEKAATQEEFRVKVLLQLLS